MTAVPPVTAIDKASIVVMMTLRILFLGERLSWTAWVGVTLVAIGSLSASVAPR